MRNKLFYCTMLTAVIAVPFTANALTCQTPPSCSELGYNDMDCSGKTSLKCPFDTSKVWCGDVVAAPSGGTPSAPDPEEPETCDPDDPTLECCEGYYAAGDTSAKRACCAYYSGEEFRLKDSNHSTWCCSVVGASGHISCSKLDVIEYSDMSGQSTNPFRQYVWRYQCTYTSNTPTGVYASPIKIRMGSNTVLVLGENLTLDGQAVNGSFIITESTNWSAVSGNSDNYFDHIRFIIDGSNGDATPVLIPDNFSGANYDYYKEGGYFADTLEFGFEVKSTSGYPFEQCYLDTELSYSGGE